jgi:hypothetical protein
MFKVFLNLLIVTLVTACSNSSPTGPSPAAADSSHDSKQGLDHHNCGNVDCDSQSEYCLKFITNAEVMNVSRCGKAPGSPCYIWQQDIGHGTIVSSGCSKLAYQNSLCGGTSGAAMDAMTKNPESCRAGLSGTMGCEDGATVTTVSCFLK